MNEPDKNVIHWSPETTFLILFLLILIPLLVMGFLP
jgi:hypothetical protein